MEIKTSRMNAKITKVTREGIVVTVEYKYTWEQLEKSTQNAVNWIKLFAKGKELKNERS